MELLTFSFLCGILSAFIPLLVKITMNWIYGITKEEILMLNEVTSLKKQMDSISMVDEFAKHAKLQRKLIKIKDELKQKANTRHSASMKNRLIFTYSLHGVMALILFCIIWIYRSVPVLVFPEERLWPISGIVSWPTGVPGGVSVAVWIWSVMKVARAVAAYVSHRFSTDNNKSRKSFKNGVINTNSFSPFTQQRADEFN